MEDIEYRDAYPKWIRVTGNITLMILLLSVMFALHHSEHKLMEKEVYCAEHHISDTVIASYQITIDSLSRENDSLKNIVANSVQRASSSVCNKEAQARRDLMQFVKWLVTDDINNQRVEIHHYNH